MRLVLKNRDLREAAALLESAYRDCTRLKDETHPARSDQVLQCWIRFGRRSVRLRATDMRGTGTQLDTAQRQSAIALTSDFLRDMKRDCASSTLQPETLAACRFLSTLDRSRQTSAPRNSNEAEIDMLFPLPPLGEAASSYDPQRLLDSPLFDDLIFPNRGTPNSLRSLSKIESQLADLRTGLEIDCTIIDSPSKTAICSASRLATAASLLSVAPQPSAVLTAPRDAHVHIQRPLRRSGAAILGTLGASGLVVAGASALIAHAMGKQQDAFKAMNLQTSAPDLRQTTWFRVGEASNRATVVGLAIVGVGALVGGTLLVLDAIQFRKREHRRRRARFSGEIGGVHAWF